jgi:hypothetical protein
MIRLLQSLAAWASMPSRTSRCTEPGLALLAPAGERQRWADKRRA